MREPTGKAITAILALWMAGLIGCAHPPPPQPEEKPVVQPSLDADTDGQVTVVEWVGYWDNRFGSMDADGDRQLALDEFLSGMEQDFENIDANKDGAVTVEEYITYWVPRDPKAVQAATEAGGQPGAENRASFQDIDLDRNEQLDSIELATFWDSRYDAGDSDGDGKMTLDEFLSTAKERFQGMDVNRDGIVTIEEYVIFWGGKGERTSDGSAPQPASTRAR